MKKRGALSRKISATKVPAEPQERHPLGNPSLNLPRIVRNNVMIMIMIMIIIAMIMVMVMVDNCNDDDQRKFNKKLP